MATAFEVAICTNPECSHTAGLRPGESPAACPVCGCSMLHRCWKCGGPVADPSAAYCRTCGVPLKRILPRSARRASVVVICTGPECDWGVVVEETGLLPSRCPLCGAAPLSHCWKCGAPVVDPGQAYCQPCGVPLKRRRRTA